MSGIHERIKRVPITQVGSDEAYEQCRLRDGFGEIDDAVAVTICAWWQSPGGYGRAMAELASTGSCNVHELLDDIYFTRKHDAKLGRDLLALAMLATWALRHPSRGES